MPNGFYLLRKPLEMVISILTGLFIMRKIGKYLIVQLAKIKGFNFRFLKHTHPFGQQIYYGMKQRKNLTQMKPVEKKLIWRNICLVKRVGKRRTCVSTHMVEMGLSINTI